jgi:hypothetical protein
VGALDRPAPLSCALACYAKNMPTEQEQGQSRSPALVCVIDAIPQAERAAHFTLAARLFHELAQEQVDLPNGYAFRFAPSTFAELAQFVSKERLCCPGVTFEITVTAGDGPLWLHLTGPEGVREFLAAELLGVGSVTTETTPRRASQL